MIYTVTFNPSLDYVVHVEKFRLGEVNRTTTEEILEGGKGINVSIVLKNLDVDSVALGFIAGFTGNEIEQGVKRHGCYTDFIHVEEGMSRINVKLKSGVESEINGQGPKIKANHIEILFNKLDQLKSGDIVVLAGSIPNTLPSDMYERILQQLEGRQIEVVVDATKDLLRKVLKYHPFLVKPNNHELGELYGVKLNTREEVIPYAQKLIDEGAQNVLVSMAEEGAVLIDATGQVHQCAAPKGVVVNSVGAGDSMVAGFLYGYLQTKNYETAFQYGIATGSASAFSSQLATKKEVYKLIQNHWGEVE